MSDKYPRTRHVPWSDGATKDDKRLSSVDHFIGVPVVITEKMDGENRCMTREAVFARTHAVPVSNPWASWAKREWASKRWDIDLDLSTFMEDIYALHSIWYRRAALERAYLHLFGVRHDPTMMWWSWEDVELMAASLDLPTAHVLFKGVLESEEHMRSIMVGDGRQPSAWGGVGVTIEPGTGYRLADGAAADENIREGCVIRLAREFHDDEFPMAVAKVVRAGHVQTTEHWKDHWVPQHDWSP